MTFTSLKTHKIPMNFASIPEILNPRDTNTMIESNTFTNSLKNSAPSLNILKKISTQKKIRSAKLTYLNNCFRIKRLG